MVERRKTASAALTLCFALRHLGTEREIVVLKVDGGNFYAFPPYAKRPLDGIEKHNAGDRALKIEMWPESHLERLLAERPAMIAEFGLR